MVHARGKVLAALLALGMAGPAPEEKKDTAAEKRPPEEHLLLRLREKRKWGGAEQDKTTTLRDVLEQLKKTWDFTYDADERAFMTDGLTTFPVLETPVVENGGIDGGKVTLAMALKRVLARVPAGSGATFLVRKQAIEITTVAAVRRELGVPADEQLPPLVLFESLDRVPLDRALDRLAEAAGATVVLDARVRGKEGKAEVTARLNNVPIDTAVRLVADMAGLSVVRLDNVLYVTSRKGARRLREERWRRPPAPLPPPPGPGM
jgi:hypothetical protein